MIHPEASIPVDHEIVQAVRAGDLDRFRELIDRYEDQVYAVAWSRLGDATLAEEVVQESFIKAYRYLDWLQNPARFGAWLTRIARGLAINLGIRNRRELRRRRRWALDAAGPSATDGAGADAFGIADDTLREALAGLSASHRECLVLHYLEGRSIQDAAHALGVTKGAFKVRLHRSRAALRESIENRLGTSLRQLGPRSSQASAIMAALPGMGSVGAGSGLFAGFGAAFAKALPAGWLFWLLPVVSAAFGVGAAAWMSNAERRNYRQPSDFRARLHRRATLRALILTAALVLIIQLGGMISFDVVKPMHVLLGVGIALWLAGLRYLQINRRPEIVAQALSAAPLWIILVVGLFVTLPPWWLHIGQLILFASMAFAYRARPLRFDYNLFLRGAKRMLPSTPREFHQRPMKWDEIMAFGRLLGSNWLVTSYRKGSTEGTFGLMPVDYSPWQMVWPFLRKRASHLILGTDGTVRVHLGERDRGAIQEILEEAPDSTAAWESQVTLAVRDALERYREGRPAEALRCLGETSESEIFVTPPSHSGAFRVQRAMFIGAALAALLMVIYQVREKPWDAFRRGETALTPTSLSLEEAQRSIARFSATRDADSARLWRELMIGLSDSDVLPPGEWLSQDGLRRIRSNLLVSAMRQVEGTSACVDMALGHARLQKALVYGWITTNDLSVYGIDAASLRQTAATWDPRHRHRRLGLETHPVAGRTNVSVLNVDDLRWRMELLRVFGCLDLVERDTVVETLEAYQVLDGRPRPAGRRPDLDVAAWHGLFATAGWSPIEETAEVLAVLEMLGALDHVHRDACLNGLLRFHHGRGKFGALDPTKDIFVRSSPLTTLRVLEAFRALGALREISDLDQWEFWIPKSLDSKPADGSIRNLLWSEIEAVLGRQRLAALRQDTVHEKQ